RLLKPTPVWTLLLRAAVVAFFANMLSGPVPVSLAADEPQPDPAGIATGDKSNAIDAAGNPFVVPEPTDKTDPDYAQKKKALDEYQEQAAKEPLAVKLAAAAGHVRIATNFGCT